MKKSLLALAALALIGTALAFAQAPTPTPPAAPIVKTLIGVIKTVQEPIAAKKVPEALFIAESKKKTDEVVLGPATLIKGLDGKAIAFAALKPGMKVSVKYVLVGKTLEAKEVSLAK